MGKPIENPVPAFDWETRFWWEGCARGELWLQRCRESGRLIFPPRATSPWAPHTTPAWTVVSGRGRIWSFAVPHPPLLPPFAELAPYNVILVALDEDPTIRLVGNLIPEPGAAIDAIDPTTIEIGAPVRAVCEAVTDEITLPRWVLA